MISISAANPQMSQICSKTTQTCWEILISYLLWHCTCMMGLPHWWH